MYKRILVPVDGSGPSSRGLQEALKLAKEGRCTVMLLHVVDELIITATPEAVYDATAVIDALREAGESILAESADVARRAGVKVQTKLVECLGGRAADAIIGRAERWKADLIVIGTHGRRGIRRLVMGSDAEQVVRMAAVPVLLVRAPEARKRKQR